MNLIEKTELKECDHDWENISKIGDTKRQLICTYCSEQKSEPFDVNVKRWSDEEADHCSDIKNHISPNTKVIEHESNKNTV